MGPLRWIRQQRDARRKRPAEAPTAGEGWLKRQSRSCLIPDWLKRKRPAEAPTAGEGETAAADTAALAQIFEKLDKSVLTVPRDFSMGRQNTVYQKRSILPPGTK
eukprot:Hpha_TRINITY_DN16502_c1_g3::TRINITY_DN16502_c1_g3_i2::g.135864::m.135864